MLLASILTKRETRLLGRILAEAIDEADEKDKKDPPKDDNPLPTFGVDGSRLLRTNRLQKKVLSHVRMLQKKPERASKYFRHVKIRYAAWELI